MGRATVLTIVLLAAGRDAQAQGRIEFGVGEVWHEGYRVKVVSSLALFPL